MIEENIQTKGPVPKMIHFGFTFDQDGWINAYLDSRPNASRDGAWTNHLDPSKLLRRPDWYEASELRDLHALTLINVDGKELQEWDQNPSLQNLARILGEFLRSCVSTFEAEGLFGKLLGIQKLSYCVEEFTGLYSWPIDPEIARFAESLKLSIKDSSSHIV
jgi:hypothetical protein